MEFPNLDTLQSFLSRWLEQHGHDVYCQVPVPSGRKVDILTQDYVIRCAHTLYQDTLQAAADDLQIQRGHFPDQKPVIAGLTPDQQWDTAYAMAEQLKGSGIEVWFIDQMPPFVGYYSRLAKQGGPEVAAPRRKAPWGGCLLSTGVAAILGLSFWLAFNILERYELQVATNTQDERAWERLHSAVEQWDINNAQLALEQLSSSRNACVSRFADQFSEALNQNGAEGFRDINPIKRTLNQQDRCRLEIQPYDFSP
ncbi:hypothetical protein GFS31_11980 [Leptolyngbya sp. BL0902]|uniref:hypothetical protein n=1 Tax=Leptolyngbya sp. BL0902 TaxID=1115757 RepID=UPI0018E8D555|nr:hypothetical protein [Leptolyngbya sp. BL0902]QQE64517.1 hypothetical protein GFS31_11980 [Leptolyngbya sp. BL0902]